MVGNPQVGLVDGCLGKLHHGPNPIEISGVDAAMSVRHVVNHVVVVMAEVIDVSSR